MNAHNLYWPVYKNLEHEFLDLANYIHISDDQTKIYSMHIADLIVRCAIEIEAIAKELYISLGGNISPTDASGDSRDLYFDTDCLDLLEQKWHISKKEITVSAINVYLVEDKNRILVPLYKANKRGTSGSKWKQAYQAIKHDRKNSLKKATVENLIYTMGALYILNLYYRDERTDIGRTYLSDHDFDNRAGSEVFSTHCFRATSIAMSYYVDDSCIRTLLGDDLEKAIFIIKYDDKSFEELHKNFCLDFPITEQRFNTSPEITKFLFEHPEYKSKSMVEICLAAGGERLLTSIIYMQNSMNGRSTRTEAIINKHTQIYPQLSPPTN